MKGTRPLDNDEIRRVSTCFTGTFAFRNRGLFMLGVSTGGPILSNPINKNYFITRSGKKRLDEIKQQQAK